MKNFFWFIQIAILALGNTAFAQDSVWLSVKENGQEEQREWQEFKDFEKGERFLDSLLKDYQLKGFPGAFFDRMNIGKDSVLILVKTGPKIQNVILRKGNVPQGFLNQDFPLVLSWNELNSVLGQVLNQAENEGYPFATVKLDSISREEGSLDASMAFDWGPMILWDSLKLGDGSKTAPVYAQLLSGLGPGDPFSQKDLDLAERNLRRSNYFRLNGTPELYFRQKKAQPIFNLIERNANVLDGVIGVLPNENEPGKVLFTGQFDLELRHLGGRGRDVEVHWQRFNPLTQNLSLKLKESFVFNSLLDVSADFSLLKQDSSFLNRVFGIDFAFRANPHLYFRFFNRRQASDLISTLAYKNAETLPDLADFRWNQFGVSMDMNLLDDPVFPRRGARFVGEFSAGNKRILQNTGIPESVYSGIDLKTPQYMGKISAEQHVFLKPHWGVFLGAFAGWIENKNLLVNDLFRLGGLKSIRGFNENYFYAGRYMYLNFEQRLFFGNDSYLLVFADAGILENPYFANEMEKPVALGTGINLETGNGVFRFIYAVGKSQEQPLSLSLSKIHFGYLARF
ncbi:BamA/TamA family outer membrane protein [Algoriphagus sp. CAU 1675]|uniref:BamA/TamA family outer membrane protein n=1 Tax=Algoriphagus sp. CAU 1675 TaxID=3032597 RepID=UPI0023DC8344|nr:BamA/TamA family outer membrane protein [Algoriphagus sp. CAU 1675]MDF2158884.1 BamA/TamA family outer membrane protein [Algoriphagus sp. CAU 1675]